MQYKRQPLKFVCGGVDLNNPVDLQPPGKFPFLKNVQAYQDGHIETRAPLSKLNSSAPSDKLIVSSFRLNDYVVEDFTRFLKINDKLYFGKTSFAQIDSGYSATLPLSAVPWQPDQSPEPWVYLSDNTRMRKAKVDGTNYQIGIVPPTVIPTAELDVPRYTIPAIFDATTDWSGNTGSQSSAPRLTGITIDVIKYISGSTGWACIVPTGGDITDLSPGMVVTLDAGGSPESNVVEQIIRAFDGGSNTINQILYDSGTSGLCTIMPTKPLGGLTRNALLQLGGSEYVRVISVANSAAGISSFRCVTSGTFSAGNAISAPVNGNLFMYLANTHAAGETITNNGIDTNVAANTYGIEAYNPSSPLALSVINNRPITPDDFIHMSFHVGSPENLSFIRLVFDVDPGTTSTPAATDGNSNAYYIDIRPNDLQAIIQSNVTIDAARQAAIAKQVLNQTALNFSTNQPSPQVIGTGQSSSPVNVSANGDPSAPSQPNVVNPTGQLIAGAFQWSEYKCRVGDLIRIGASVIVDLSAVTCIQIRVFTNANTTGGPGGTGGTFLHWGGLWIGGTYGPDTSLGDAPLIYRYAYRSSATGAKSLPGPAMRSGIQAFRQQILLRATASTDPQVDKIDFERFGAQNLAWNFIGEVSNSSPTFADDQLSAAIEANGGLATDIFQPFPLADTPKSSTVTVAGTAIHRTAGDNFDVSWARGTEVYINGVLTELYASPTSTTLLHVADAMPSGTGITMTIPAPIKAGQPLPYMWGPFFNCMFACGNVLDAGSVYYTKPGDPDAAPDTNRIEVTSPSEVMVGGCVYDGRAYCWSDKRMFSIIPAFNDPSQFQFVVVPNGKGLWSPYAIAIGPRMWYLAADGIYESDGGTSVCISDDIKMLFFQNDVPGFSAHGMDPIQMTKDGMGTSFIHRLRLTYHNDMVIFDYLDCHGVARSLAYDVHVKGWFPYLYFEGDEGNNHVVFHASEQAVEASNLATHLVAGTDQGFLCEAGASGSGDETIQCTIRTPAIDAGDSRAKKIYGDIVLDMNSQGVPVVCTPWINNYTQAITGKTFITLQRQITDPIDLSSGVGQFARNLGLDISWTLAT